MKNKFSRAAVVLFTLIVCHAASPASYAKIYSYKLFDPMIVPQPAVIGGGRVAWWNQFPFHIGIMSRGGRMILSKNPDGTGDARVGDTLQVWANHPNHGNYIFTYNAHRPNCFFEDPPAMPPQDVTPYFPVLNAPYDVTVRILDWCGKEKTTDSLYLVNITNEPEQQPTPNASPMPSPTSAPTVTPTPTQMPTPTPIPVKPFLDLPWDYRSKGLSFTDAALSIEAFFDHAFPLLSTGMTEREDEQDTIVKYDGTKTREAYSSHDGYDYAKRAAAQLGEPVLAAAAGKASYVNNCRACGKMVVVDHGNGYQTRYMHMSPDGLITSTPGVVIDVTPGQQIGAIGFTGNVLPPGDLGAHIHFMVIHDKNRDGNFDDNIPDGVTDPFGWQPAFTDPWSTHTFTYNGELKSGSTSKYLWKNTLDTASGTVNPQTATTISIPHLSVTFPEGSYSDTYFIQANAAAYSNTDKSRAAIGNAFMLSAINESNQIISLFRKAFTIRIDFKKADITVIKPETLAIYSSPDGQTWQKEETAVSIKNGYAIATPNHMTYFALLGERKDTTAPSTTASLRGKEGQEGWYRSQVELILKSKDNKNGSGVEYITYQVDKGDRQVYKKPIIVSGDGTHMIRYFSVDRDSNVEEEQVIRFTIDIRE